LSVTNIYFSQTIIILSFFLSTVCVCVQQYFAFFFPGTLCFYKSNIEWKLGEEPRTIVDLVGLAIRPSDRGRFTLCDFNR